MTIRMTPEGQGDTRRAALTQAKRVCRLLLQERTGPMNVTLAQVPPALPAMPPLVDAPRDRDPEVIRCLM
ncbi:hypothetical protein ACRARG_04725 [Pseudooceanicola sp. C21-150M6]|uniref:hypothetical protein n=1 Tax=Pseudooceanicola sp. C21-150M6 TaxID=3434355 RepID=UPI003D7FF41F